MTGCQAIRKAGIEASMHKGRHAQRQASGQRIRLKGRHYGRPLGNDAG